MNGIIKMFKIMVFEKLSCKDPLLGEQAIQQPSGSAWGIDQRY